MEQDRELKQLFYVILNWKPILKNGYELIGRITRGEEKAHSFCGLVFCHATVEKTQR